MIERFVEACLSRRGLVLLVVLVLVILGALSLRETSVDAIPDIGENLVIVYTNWPGRSPRDVEDQVTYPLTVNLMGVPKVKTVRSTSMFGFSLVNVIFEDNVDYYWARTRVLEKLEWASRDLPEGVEPTLGPDATLVGQIFWYAVEGEGHDLYELRSINDYYIKLALQSLNDVAEVASVGGFVKEYRVEVDPAKLLSYGVPVTQVIGAVKSSNMDVGAEVLEEGDTEFVVRGVGFIRSIEDIENVVVAARDGVPVLVKHVGSVTVAPDFRRGALDKDGREATGGVVLMRYGGNPRKVIRAVKGKIAEIEPGLPVGVKIVPFYDRTRLIEQTTRTLEISVILQIAATVVVVFLMLGHAGTSAAVALGLPVSILATFIVMNLMGQTSNLMSISGIALSIGVMVDSGIIMAENIYKKLALFAAAGGTGSRLDAVKAAAREVARPIFFSVIIIIIAFANIYFLRGQAGKLFRPLALTENIIMAASAILAISLVPVLSYYFIRGRVRSLDDSRLTRGLIRSYGPVLGWVLDHKRAVLAVALIVLVAAFVSTRAIKSEFMPPLNEGDILFMPVLLPGATVDQVMEVMRKQDEILMSFPEVDMVVGKLGRAETATDPAPVSMIETVIRLKPRGEWRPGLTREKLIAEMDRSLVIPGVSNIWTQPIRNRIDMLATGIQTPVGAKIFGPDQRVIERVAVDVERVLRGVEGAVNPFAERTGDRPYLEISVDRERAARHGISVATVNSIVATAVGGRNISTFYRGRERYPISVTYAPEYKEDPDLIGRLPVPTSHMGQVPLSQVASIERTLGPAMIATENAVPYGRVFVNIDPDRTGVLDFVDRARAAVASQVDVPPGYFISWEGQYKYEVETRRRLLLVIPLCLVAIFIVLYIEFGSMGLAGLVFSALPFAFVGGILLQHALGYKFSTAVWIGYVALFGVAVEDGLALVEHLKHKMVSWTGDTREMVIEAATYKLRPILMTTVTTILALLPIMLSKGTGSEIMKPIAAPVVGGMVTATLLNLFIVPVLFALYARGRRNTVS
ncbi:MAG: CusA/CzcA family heavy metal efflux RND transporter [bacterium]